MTSDPVVTHDRGSALLRHLVERTPAASQLAVIATAAREGVLSRMGRRVHAIDVAPTPRRAGGDPDDGCGALDRLAIARMRGATHFLLPATEAWCLERYPELRTHLTRRASLVAGNESGSLWRLPPAPAPGPPKVFCIGLNKTGTSSLHLALAQLGYASHHWGGREAYHAVLEAQRDGERLLHHVGEDHDCYSDIGPLSVRFDLADLQYPGSRFVLTLRDVDEWVGSRRRHAQRNLRNQRAGKYSGSNVRVDEALWRAQWHQHVDRVTSWFEGRDELLVLDIGGGMGWEHLAPFLGRPVPATPFPRENVDRASTRARGSTNTKAGSAHMQQVKRAVKKGWRQVRGHLPPGVARAISDPTKKVLRKLGLMSPPKRSRKREQKQAARV